MRLVFFIVFLFSFSGIFAQKQFSGQVFMKENSVLYLYPVYVTNITEHKTILSSPNGEFTINARPGDIIRFTSIITERKDFKVTEEALSKAMHFIELKPGYYEIKEVIIGWKPTGNIHKDVLSLKKEEKILAIAKMIGLPEPKGDGTPPVQPVAGFSGGGLTFSVESIYDILSGERKKKERLYELERMNAAIDAMKKYFGKEYFDKMRIPENLTGDFLQFVYTSDNIKPYLEAKNFEATKPYIEKYLPIYQKRLRDSQSTNYLSN